MISSPPASLEKDPIRRAYAEFALFALHSAHGRYEEAQAHLQRAIQFSPQEVFLLQRMALLLKKRKKYGEALEYAQRCVALAPDNVTHHLLVAEISGLMEDEETAIRAYERALDLDPRKKRARLVLTTLLIKKNRYTEALEQLDRITEQDPSLVIAHYYRGRVFLEMGKPAQSEEAYQEALRLNERMEPALFDLGSLYQMQGRFEEAFDERLEWIASAEGNVTELTRLYESVLRARAAMLASERVIHLLEKMARRFPGTRLGEWASAEFTKEG